LLVLNVESRAPLQIGIRDGYLKSMGYKDTWSAAKAIGVRAIEIDLNTDLSCKNLYEADGSGHSIANAAGIQKLKETLKSWKIEVSAFCTVIPIAGEMTPEQVQHWVAATAAGAKELKVPIIMMPLIARGIEDREFIERAQQFVKPLERIAEDTGVQLTIENLGHYLNRKEILEPILKSFRVRHVGLALDICNMYWFGHPLPVLYELAEFFAPYVRYVHVKSVKYPEDQREERRPEGWEYMKYAEPVPTGDLDFSRILKLYYRAGYRGPVTLEDDSLEKYQMPELRQVHIRDRQSLENIVKVLGRGN
jgi:sugar phosphate isomerase/epimerase